MLGFSPSPLSLSLCLVLSNWCDLMWFTYALMCAIVQCFCRTIIGRYLSLCVYCWGRERSAVSPRPHGNRRWLKAASALCVRLPRSHQQRSVSVHWRERANHTVTAATREWRHHRTSRGRKTFRCDDLKGRYYAMTLYYWIPISPTWVWLS